MRSAAGGARKVASAAFILAAFGFLAAYVLRDLGELRAYPWALRPGLLVGSVALNVVGLVWGAAVWQFLLRRAGVRVPFRGLARVWFISALGRYIPGKIWQFVSAAHLGAAIGVPAIVAVSSLALHAGIFLLAALAVAVYFVPAGVGDLGGVAIEPLRWLAPLTILLVHPAVIRRGLGLAHRLARRELADWTGTWLDGIVLLAAAVASWLVSGFALYVFFASLVPLGPGVAAEVIGINALAFLVGYAVFIAPAGIGAKEGAMAALLSLIVPISVAALLAVAARLWSVLSEVAPALVLLRGGSPAPSGEAAPDGASIP